MSEPKRGSQFAGAAAMFRKKESDLMEKKGPNDKATKQFNASMGNIAFSPHNSQRASLKAPSFVSPGLKKTQSEAGGWKKSPGALSSPPFGANGSLRATSSFATPKQGAKAKMPSSSGFGGLAFSPSPQEGQSKTVNGKSWKDKASISFQATSPHQLQKKTVQQIGAWKGKGDSDAMFSPLRAAKPDITIKVKIPDIDKKILARKNAAAPPPNEKDENVPEHIRKFREREAARKKKEENEQFFAAQKLQAFFLGWQARAAYPALRKANEARLQKMAQERAKAKRRAEAAIKIQKVYRGWYPRKRFLRVRELKRRRQRNEKEIKQIEKKIAKMPKETKATIKEMKKEYAEKKKEVKKKLKKMMKDEDNKLEEIKKSGQNMIDYLRNENSKVRDQQASIKKDYKMLEKQFELLTQKSEEIAKNFKSLQQYVDKKNAVIQKQELGAQKCRNRYIPQHREELKDRNRHCLVENHVKVLYKQRLYKIMKELILRCNDNAIIEDAQLAIEECESELKAMPKMPVPEGLKDRLK